LFLHGDVEKADQEQNRALELNPNFPAGLTRTSKIWRHWFQGRMPEAHQEAAIFRSKGMAKVGPSFQIMIRPYLARFYLFAGNTPEALSLLETNQDMTFPMANAALSRWNRFERALVYEGLGDVKQSEKFLRDEAAESVGVHRIEALGWLAISLARRGLPGQARSRQAELKKESRLPPANFWLPPLPQELARAKQAFDRQIEGEILLSEKRYGSALSCFQEVQKLVPRRTSIFQSALAPRIGIVAGRSLGKVYEQRGEWESAVNIYRDILQHKELCISTIGVSDLWILTLQSIIQALEKAGRPAEAAKYREEYRCLRLPSL
jgi:tetratricopeptide (TPR) repeat protein